MRFWLKQPEAKPIVKMVVHGQRSEGEDFIEVTVGVDQDDRIRILGKQPVEAPPNRRPIIVPAMGNLAMEQVDFLLEGARKSQEYSNVNPHDMPLPEYNRWLGKMWLDYVEQKLKWLKGQTTIGPGGFNQREAPRGKL